MKFWNKSKEYRETWITVQASHLHPRLKQWCQQQESKSRFFVKSVDWHEKDTRAWCFSWKWYFEDPKDALIFKLKFCTK